MTFARTACALLVATSCVGNHVRAQETELQLVFVSLDSICTPKSFEALKYNANTLTLTKEMLYGFRKRWHERIGAAVGRHPKLTHGQQWIDGLFATHFKDAQSKVIAVQLHLRTREAWLLMDGDATGNMVSYRIDSKPFEFVAILIDAFICNSNKAYATTFDAPNLAVIARQWAKARQSAMVAPSAKVEMDLRWFGRIGQADQRTLDTFQQAAPLDYETSLKSRALYAAATEELVSKWGLPSAQTETLKGLAITAVPPAKADSQLDIAKVLELFRTGAANKRGVAYLASSSPETNEFFWQLSDKTIQQVAKPDVEFVVKAIEKQKFTNPNLKLY